MIYTQGNILLFGSSSYKEFKNIDQCKWDVQKEEFGGKKGIKNFK